MTLNGDLREFLFDLEFKDEKTTAISDSNTVEKCNNANAMKISAQARTTMTPPV